MGQFLIHLLHSQSLIKLILLKWIFSCLDHSLCNFSPEADRVHRDKSSHFLQGRKLSSEHIAFGHCRKGHFCITFQTIKGIVHIDLDHSLLNLGLLIFRSLHGLQRRLMGEKLQRREVTLFRSWPPYSSGISAERKPNSPAFLSRLGTSPSFFSSISSMTG